MIRCHSFVSIGAFIRSYSNTKTKFSLLFLFSCNIFSEIVLVFVGDRNCGIDVMILLLKLCFVLQSTELWAVGTGVHYISG